MFGSRPTLKNSKISYKDQEMSSGGTHYPCASTPETDRDKHRYDMRHQCQEILPGLLLGPFQVSKNQVTLTELGISHMYASCSEFLLTVLSFVSLDCLVLRVCIRDVKEAFSVRPRFPEAFEYLVLDVQDSEEQNLIRLFPTFVL
jgi:hypothetical protein